MSPGRLQGDGHPTCRLPAASRDGAQLLSSVATSARFLNKAGASAPAIRRAGRCPATQDGLAVALQGGGAFLIRSPRTLASRHAESGDGPANACTRHVWPRFPVRARRIHLGGTCHSKGNIMHDRSRFSEIDMAASLPERGEQAPFRPSTLFAEAWHVHRHVNRRYYEHLLMAIEDRAASLPGVHENAWSRACPTFRRRGRCPGAGPGRCQASLVLCPCPAARAPSQRRARGRRGRRHLLAAMGSGCLVRAGHRADARRCGAGAGRRAATGSRRPLNADVRQAAHERLPVVRHVQTPGRVRRKAAVP